MEEQKNLRVFHLTSLCFDHWITGYLDIIPAALKQSIPWNISVIISHIYSFIHIGFEKFSPLQRSFQRTRATILCLCDLLFLLWILCFICSLADELWLSNWGELCSVTLLFFPLCPYPSPRGIMRLPSFKKSLKICCWQSFCEGWLFYLISITYFFSHPCFDSYHCLHQHKIFVCSRSFKAS